MSSLTSLPTSSTRSLSRSRALMFPAIALVAASPSTALAQSTINTDRPGFTYSPLLMEPGRFQLELGIPSATIARGDGADSELWNAPSLLRYGVTRDVELRLGGTTWNRLVDHGSTTSGLGDLELGTKFALGSREDSAPKLAAIATVRLPTGDDDFTSSRVGCSLQFVGDWDLGDGNLLRGLTGATYTPTSDSNSTTGAIGTLLGHAFDDRRSGYVEIGWFPGIEDAVDAAIGGVGAAWLATDDLQFDVFADFGLNSGAPDATLGFGVSLRL